MTKRITFMAILLSLAFCLPVMAQEATSTATSIDEIISQTDVKPVDLGVNGMGFFSRLWLNIRATLSTNPISKSELEAQKANIAILLAKAQIEKDPTSATAQTALQKAEELQIKIMARIEKRLEEVKNTGDNIEKVKSFLKKYADQQLKQQTILQKLSTLVPAKAYEKIAQNRERHLEKFSELMNKLQDKQELQATVRDLLRNSTSTDELRIQNLDTIERMEAINPAIKEKIKELKTEIKDDINELKDRKQEILRARQEATRETRDQENRQDEVSNDDLENSTSSDSN